MTCRPLVATSLLLCLALAEGCRSPQLVSRPLNPREVGWACAIQRSYPGWQPPFLIPTRDDWQPRPQAPTVPMLPLGPPLITPVASAVTGEAPTAQRVVAPVPVGERQTVVDVTLPSSPPAAPVTKMLPPVLAGGLPAASPEPLVSPARVIAEPELQDVDFVPADK